VKEDGMGGECRANGNMRNTYESLIGKPEGKTPFRKHGLKWDKILKRILREQIWKERICLAQDRKWRHAFMSSVMNLRVQ
jgi:hypothetical protein